MSIDNHIRESLQLAQLHCNQGESGCSWYHGSWYLLKSLGLVSTSAVHEQSIIKLLKIAMTGMTAPKILITGSTDETLVRLAHTACQALDIDEELYALDLCGTPLAFMQAYAKNNNLQLQTRHSDILELETANKYDIILTHAFMGYFDDSQRPLLVKKWHDLLTDRGRIVTIQRIRPENSATLVTFSSQQSSGFVSAAIAAAKNLPTDDDGNKPDLDIIKSAAAEFANKFTNYAITSKTAFENLFTTAGLNLLFIEYLRLAKKAGLSGPSVPSDAEFAHIIAEKTQR